jgi:hypothetical protein
MASEKCLGYASLRIACQCEPGWRFPKLNDCATKRNLVHSEGPRVYYDSASLTRQIKHFE